MRQICGPHTGIPRFELELTPKRGDTRKLRPSPGRNILLHRAFRICLRGMGSVVLRTYEPTVEDMRMQISIGLGCLAPGSGTQ